MSRLAVLVALLIFALLAPPAKSDVPATAGAVPQSEFEATRSAGITAVGTSDPSPALSQSRTPSPATVAAPAVAVSPSLRAVSRLVAVRAASRPLGLGSAASTAGTLRPLSKVASSPVEVTP